MNEYHSKLDPFFEAKLMLKLKLEADGKEVEIHTANIQHIMLNLHLYGHAGEVEIFAVNNSDLDEMMSGSKLIKITFSFLPADAQKGVNPLLEIKGIVRKRSQDAIPPTTEEDTKSKCVYTIFFEDAVKATLEEKYPTNIYVDSSMKEVIEKHGHPDIPLEFDWDILEKKHPIIAFSLVHKPWCFLHEQTNFYSFLIWYLHQENGLLLYDYQQNAYKLTSKKVEASETLEVYEWFVSNPKCIYPNPLRYNETTIKHDATTCDGEDKENEDAIQSVKREVFDSSNYRVYPEQASEAIHSVLTPEKNQILIEFIKFSDDVQIDKLTPGSFVSFKGYDSGGWSKGEAYKDKNFRIQHLLFKASKLNPAEDIDKPILENPEPFGLYIQARLEDEEESYVAWPKFTPPKYPFYIQGTVFCDIGEEEQSTYKILDSDEAPQGQYLVLVPLAGEEKKVVTPFVPAFSGQYYYPYSKDSRVMLEMHFHTARIERPIDWDPLARLPAGVQGNQIVLASNGKDKYTIISHEYVDGKDSVFVIKQSSSDTPQTQTIQVKEKDISITVDEEGKKTLFIQLNHDSGLLLSLEDKEAGMTQQVLFDGESMTHTCKGSAGTSIIAQKPESISFECKEFLVKSDSMTFDVKDMVTVNAKNKVDIATKIVSMPAPSVKCGP